MKRILFLLLFMFSFIKMNACQCDIPIPILEFQSAKYVFEGKVISKVYAKDSLTYTVTFEISKHYKKSDNPKILEFTFESEGEYTGVWTSCDWGVNKGEIWLVYAEYWNDKLTFGYNCSNSKPIEKSRISKKEQIFLDTANELDINNYTFTSLDGSFTKAKPKIDLDSILKKYRFKEYGKEYSENRADIFVDIDENGNLIKVGLTLKEQMNNEIKIPITTFDKDMLKTVGMLKKWQKTYIEGTRIPVKIRKFLQFYKKSNKIKVYY